MTDRDRILQLEAELKAALAACRAVREWALLMKLGKFRAARRQRETMVTAAEAAIKACEEGVVH